MTTSIQALVDALEKISNPIAYLRKKAEEDGGKLDGAAAIQLSKDGIWLSSIATQALADYHKSQKEETVEDTLKKMRDYVPSDSNSDLASLASHSCTVGNPIEHLKYEKVFEFSTFQNWVNTAQQKFKQFKRWEGDQSQHIICLDINGNCLSLGEDFMKAEKENLFPVTAYRLIRTIENDVAGSQTNSKK